jgi:hypothetical protein
MPTNTTNAARAARGLEHQRQALELRRAGLGYEAIGERLGLKKSQSHRLVTRALEEARAQVTANADELRAEELSRLDGMLQGLWPRARKGEVSAVDRVLKIAERRAKLLGLDAPEKRELFGKGGTPLVPGALDPSGLSTQTLQELLAARDAAARRG